MQISKQYLDANVNNITQKMFCYSINVMQDIKTSCHSSFY